MKNVFVSAVLVLSAGIAKASVYDCKQTDEGSSGSLVFMIDTAKDDNRIFDLGNGQTAGCIVFRAIPQLVGCTLGSANFSAFATAEDGSAVISVTTLINGKKSDLTCVKTE